MSPSPDKRQSPLIREDFLREDLCELSPLIWKKQLCHLECVRPGRGGKISDYYLLLRNAETGEELSHFAEGYGLASAYVHDDVFYAFASRWEEDAWNDIPLFCCSDLIHWEGRKVVDQEGGEHLFNSSVCSGPDGFVMAYESNDPTYPAFTTKFVRSNDLQNWQKIPEAIFGTNRHTANPCIRYSRSYYYMLYLEHRKPRHYFETYITRSPDLIYWETSVANPILVPENTDEGINTSDPEIVELDGRTHLLLCRRRPTHQGERQASRLSRYFAEFLRILVRSTRPT
ncbi:MAG: hypothetical protein QF595_06245 [Dehalococcoidia bacterium]|nr:hypothetical protein [Dehalococcoidia bacterium]